MYRCVVNWFGDWSMDALYQVGLEFTNKLDLDKSDVSASLSYSQCLTLYSTFALRCSPMRTRTCSRHPHINKPSLKALYQHCLQLLMM